MALAVSALQALLVQVALFVSSDTQCRNECMVAIGCHFTCSHLLITIVHAWLFCIQYVCKVEYVTIELLLLAVARED